MRLPLLIVLFYTLIDFATAKSFLPRSFNADIEQQTKSVIKLKKGNKEIVKKYDVVVKYLFPSNVYLKVEDSTYVCNKNKTWLYTPPVIEGEKGEVKIGSSSKYCYSKLFDALSNGLSNNKIYSTKKSKNTATLSFSTKAQDQLQMTKVELLFEKLNTKSRFSDIKEMRMFKVGEKNPTIFVFKSLNRKVKLKASDFEFQVPKNTNINNW